MEHGAAHQAIDGFRGCQGFTTDGAQFSEAPRLRQHLAFQRADGAVVGVDRSAQALSGAIQMPGKGGETAVQILAQLQNPGGVFRDHGLAPAVGDRLEQCHER